MGNTATLWLIAAVLLIVIGLGIFASAMCGLKWDFTALSTESYETNVYVIPEDFTNISIIDTTADITFVSVADGAASVTLREESTAKHTVTVEDGTLRIENTGETAWYQRIGIHFDTPSITVAIPQKQYGSLSVQITTGDIALSDLSVDSMELKTSTGSIRISNTTCTGDAAIHVTTGPVRVSDLPCKNLTSTGNTGDISLANVLAASVIRIQRTTGDISFDRCDAGELQIQTNTGSVTGSLLSEKCFITKTTTGDIDTPRSVPGSICRIQTTTGDIRITVE